MRNNFEIPYRNLKYTCDPSIFKFTTTADVKSNYKGLGQQRGIASLEFGLSVDTKGYNVYLEGPTGSGKTTYTKEYLDKISRTKKVPPDWVYVYNFDDPNEPVAISLTAGEGIKFKDSMEKFVKDIRHDIRNTFKSDELEKEKSIITREFEERKEKFLNDLNKKSAKYGFQVKSSETGIYMMPIVDGKVIKEDEFEKLDAEIKKEYEDKSEIVQQEIIEVIGKIRALDAEAENRINDWRTNIALLTISGHIYYVKSNLKRNKKVSTFLDGVKKDILKNISKFIDDYTMLRPGLLQEANGGYIILQANDLLSNPQSYEYLKKILRNKLIRIDNSVDQKTSMVLISLKPEPIPLDLKVILIGPENVYQTLLAVDEEFRKLFKIKVEFEDSAKMEEKNLLDLAGFVHNFCETEELLPLDKFAMAKLAEYSSRLAENQNKLSTRFGEMTQIIVEAATWAKIAKCKVISDEHIHKALVERDRRLKKYDSKYSEMINDKFLLIDTDGAKVGQINGLTVMSLGDYSFGKPVRITASTYTGVAGIVNVEREVELSGPTHSKGMLILTGFLGNKFAKDKPLSLSATICFEQLYNGIDGDSASSTELYALLSSLSEIPIAQGIAVTGSINQKGEIQAIGGVNEKIEGFFEICRRRGLTGSQGVMIPKQNIVNLNLHEDVIKVVKEGKFHIYGISTIDEGIEILTGVPAGDINVPGTVYYLVNQTLKKFIKNVRDNK